MITELQNNEFLKCINMVDLTGHMEVIAVIERINPGRIFVDDTSSPTSGLIWLGNNDGFFFIGDEKNTRFNSEINDFVDSVILPEAKSQGLDAFEAIGNHPAWNKTIEEVFSLRGLERWNQKVYKLLPGDYRSTSNPEVNAIYSTVMITKELYEDSSIKNPGFLHKKINECWRSPEEFFQSGIGHAVLCDNEIVTLCLSGLVADNMHCIGIETLEEHRGRKLAQKAAHSFAKECLQMGGVPYWDCMADNKPSVAIAESLGFSNVFNYSGYYFIFD